MSISTVSRALIRSNATAFASLRSVACKHAHENANALVGSQQYAETCKMMVAASRPATQPRIMQIMQNIHQRAYSATSAAQSQAQSEAQSQSQQNQPTQAKAKSSTGAQQQQQTNQLVPRTNICVVGKMNVGKSTLMNLLTAQNTSIVDNFPGTTADTKVALLEVHSLGPCKLFDTAGIDEKGGLGQKKRDKTWNVIKESDVMLFVTASSQKVEKMDDLIPEEREALELAQHRNKVVVMIENVFSAQGSAKFQPQLELKPTSTSAFPFPRIRLDLSDTSNSFNALIDFITKVYMASPLAFLSNKNNPLIPYKYLGKTKRVLMNIPMDAETPSGRLLRPQARVQEFCLSNYTSVCSYRMDLASGRNQRDAKIRDEERDRFLQFLTHVQPDLIVTDSQAMDLVFPWIQYAEKEKLIPEHSVALTTFSILMINELSGGRLTEFVKGLEAVDKLKAGDRILIAEACNHNRITEQCEDIGSVQIPRHFKQRMEQANASVKDLVIDHAFGREFPVANELQQYSLVVHCGACMIDPQKVAARIEDCVESNVPIVNYGLLLSYFQSKQALTKVLEPWAGN